jgi:hypothetical protein
MAGSLVSCPMVGSPVKHLLLQSSSSTTTRRDPQAPGKPPYFPAWAMLGRCCCWHCLQLAGRVSEAEQTTPGTAIGVLTAHLYHTFPLNKQPSWVLDGAGRAARCSTPEVCHTCNTCRVTQQHTPTPTRRSGGAGCAVLLQPVATTTRGCGSKHGASTTQTRLKQPQHPQATKPPHGIHREALCSCTRLCCYWDLHTQLCHPNVSATSGACVVLLAHTCPTATTPTGSSQSQQHPVLTFTHAWALTTRGGRQATSSALPPTART